MCPSRSRFEAPERRHACLRVLRDPAVADESDGNVVQEVELLPARSPRDHALEQPIREQPGLGSAQKTAFMPAMIGD
jgi:hypothetical protein